MSRPLPRFTDHQLTHDPLEIMLAQRQAQHDQARARINTTGYATPDPTDLRGIPCIAKGVGGTQPGTNPATAILRHRCAT